MEKKLDLRQQTNDSLLQRSKRFMSLYPFVFYLAHYA